MKISLKYVCIKLCPPQCYHESVLKKRSLNIPNYYAMPFPFDPVALGCMRPQSSLGPWVFAVTSTNLVYTSFVVGTFRVMRLYSWSPAGWWRCYSTNTLLRTVFLWSLGPQALCNINHTFFSVIVSKTKKSFHDIRIFN